MPTHLLVGCILYRGSNASVPLVHWYFTDFLYFHCPPFQAEMWGQWLLVKPSEVK